jgi:hypothetical protein
MRFNNDSSLNYARHMIHGTGSAVAVYAGASQTEMWFAEINVNPYISTQVVDILDYTSTSKNKTLRSLNGVDTNNTGGNNVIALTSGLWINNTTAINRITIFPISGTFNQHSQFALYGIKGA